MKSKSSISGADLNIIFSEFLNTSEMNNYWLSQVKEALTVFEKTPEHLQIEYVKNQVLSVREKLKTIDEKKAQKKSLKIKKVTLEKLGFYGIYNFNYSTNVFVDKDGELFDRLEPIEKNKGVHFNISYSLYVGVVGQGNKPIIIKSRYKIDKGDNKLYLKPLDEEELSNTIWELKQEALERLCKLLRVKLRKGDGKDRENRPREELIVDFLNLDFVFFELMLPIDKEEIKQIGNPSMTISKILKNGLSKDGLLDYVSMADIPEVNPNLIEPRNYMKYAPHKIIITNEKVGKSFNSLIITGESALERPTEAGLLGFADAKGKSYGKLHGRTKQTYIEEVQEEKTEEIFGKCHTYMEIGETYIARGIGINIFGHSGITFQGNPKDKENVTESTLLDYLMIKQFRDFLNVISKNVKPFASRIGLTLFDDKLQKVRGKPSNNDIIDKGHKVIKTIAEGFRDEFTVLFTEEEIVSFLNEEYDQDYKNTVLSISQSCTDKTVKDYIEGQTGAYRHTKGIALRLAWLDKGLESLWDKGKVDIDELLESAEEHLETLKKRNIKSYTNIINLLNSEVYEEILKYNVKSIKPDYLKLAVYTLFEWIIDNPESTDKIIPLSEIEEYFRVVKGVLGIGVNHVYRSFSRVKEFVNNYKGNISSLLSDFGLDFDRLNCSFIILNGEKVKQQAPLYRKLSNTINTDNTHNTNNTINTNNKEDVLNVLCVKEVAEEKKSLNDQKKKVDLPSLVDLCDEGKGARSDIIEDLAKNKNGWNDSKLDKELKLSKERGEIIEFKPNRWKVLK